MRGPEIVGELHQGAAQSLRLSRQSASFIMRDPAIVGKVHHAGAESLTLWTNFMIGIWDCPQTPSCGCAGNISCRAVLKFRHAGSCYWRQSSSAGCRKPNTVGKFHDRDLGFSAHFMTRVRRQHQLPSCPQVSSCGILRLSAKLIKRVQQAKQCGQLS